MNSLKIRKFNVSFCCDSSSRGNYYQLVIISLVNFWMKYFSDLELNYLFPNT